ncbi:hypothetical protein GY14_32280 [Delftia tsuruhatensis]|nr:hypothetical protein GY14_32280 [Delftia tsuruhatensis]
MESRQTVFFMSMSYLCSLGWRFSWFSALRVSKHDVQITVEPIELLRRQMDHHPGSKLPIHKIQNTNPITQLVQPT